MSINFLPWRQERDKKHHCYFIGLMGGLLVAVMGTGLLTEQYFERKHTLALAQKMQLAQQLQVLDNTRVRMMALEKKNQALKAQLGYFQKEDQRAKQTVALWQAFAQLPTEAYLTRIARTADKWYVEGRCQSHRTFSQTEHFLKGLSDWQDLNLQALHTLEQTAPFPLAFYFTAKDNKPLDGK